MPQYQIHVAATLATALVASLATWFVAGPQEKPLVLPTSTDGGLVADPFEVTKPQDCFDGIPVNESKFWTKVSVSGMLLHPADRNVHGRCVCENSH